MSHSVLTPTHEEILSSYKSAAKTLANKEGRPLTEIQHEIGRAGGFEDWQKFNYYVKGLSDLDVGLAKEEWFFIIDAVNGLFCSLDTPEDLSFLVTNADAYDSLSFGEQSLFDDENDSYQPTERMQQFIDKLRNLSELKEKAIVASALWYWNRPLFNNQRKYLESSLKQPKTWPQ